MFSIDHLTTWLETYRYLVLFPLVILEGPIVTIIAGSMAALGQFNFFAVYAVIVIGDLVGDSLYYAAGRFGRRRFIDKFGHYIGIDEHNVRKVERHFKDHSGKTLIFGKISHVVGSVILVAAGMVRMSFSRFITFNFLATIPKSLFFLLVGFYFGLAYLSLSHDLNYIAVSMMLLIFLIWIVYVVIKKVIPKYEELIDDEDTVSK